MTYKKLISVVAHKTGYRRYQVEEVIETLGDVVVEALKTDGEVKPIKGVTLYKDTKKPRNGYDPYRDINIVIPERIRLESRFTDTFTDKIINV